MASKKASNPVETVELVKAEDSLATKKEAPAKARKQVFTVKGRNPYANDPEYQDLKTIFLPMARAGEQPNAEIRLNGVKWMIPRGKPVEVPRPVYEQFQRKIRNEVSEIRLQNAMMGAMAPENFGMGYRLNEEPEGI